MKVLMEAKDIPVGSLVTKKTGEKMYTLRDDIKIFGSVSPEQKEMIREIRADKGTRFMVDNDGNINIVHGNQELTWHATRDAVRNWIFEQESHQ